MHISSPPKAPPALCEVRERVRVRVEVCDYAF